MDKGKEIRIYHGLVIYFIAILMLVLVATPIQLKLGMYGLAITELLILVIGIAPVWIFRKQIKKVLPIKFPKVKELIGIVLLWIGCYFILNIVVLVTQYFFPELADLSEDMAELFTSIEIVPALIIVAVLPAICEEILFRGILLFTLKDIKSNYKVVAISGILFGAFHLSIFRFLPTAILGVVITIIMLKTRNILLPILFHFLNNFVSVWTAISAQNSEIYSMDINISQLTIGVSIITATMAPILIWLGFKLLVREREDKNKYRKDKRYRNTAIVTSTCFLLIGSLLVGFYKPTNLLSHNKTYSVNYESDEIVVPIQIEESGNYYLDILMKNERGINEFKLMSPSGEVVRMFSANDITVEWDLELDVGEYSIVIICHIDKSDPFFSVEDEKYFEDWGMLKDPDIYTDVELKIDIMQY